MICSDSDLLRLQHKGCFPMDSHIGPSSVDLTLSDSFCMTFLPDGEEIIDIMNQTKFKSWNSEFLVMDSNDFILASTNESIKVPLDHAAFVAGRSSIGRIGIQVQNAGFVDSGFEGEVTLELHNQSNKKILLHKGMRICQIVFMKMTSSCIKPYNGKYQFQKGATFSKIHEDVINPM